MVSCNRKIGDIKKEIFNDNIEGNQFYEKCVSYLDEGNIEVIEQILQELKEKQKDIRKFEFVDDKLQYFSNNEDKMQYASYKEKKFALALEPLKAPTNMLCKEGLKWQE